MKKVARQMAALGGLAVLVTACGGSDPTTRATGPAVEGEIELATRHPVKDEELGRCVEIHGPADEAAGGGEFVNDVPRPYSGFVPSEGARKGIHTWLEVSDWDLPTVAAERSEYLPGHATALSSPTSRVVGGPEMAAGIPEDEEWRIHPAELAYWDQELAAGNKLVMRTSRLDSGAVAVLDVFAVRPDGTVGAIGNCKAALTELLADAATTEGVTAAEVLYRAAADENYRSSLRRYIPDLVESPDEPTSWYDLSPDKRQVFPLAGTPQELLDRLVPMGVQVELDAAWTHSGLGICPRQSHGWGVCASLDAGDTAGQNGQGQAPIGRPAGGSFFILDVWADLDEPIEMWLLDGNLDVAAPIALLVTIPVDAIATLAPEDGQRLTVAPQLSPAEVTAGRAGGFALTGVAGP